MRSATKALVLQGGGALGSYHVVQVRRPVANVMASTLRIVREQA